MKLDQFIKETICEIAQGFVDSRDEVHHHGVVLGWPVSGATSTVDFDVALTTTDETGAKGGLGVFLGSVGAGGSATSNQGKSSMTRVQFKVPIHLPARKQVESPPRVMK